MAADSGEGVEADLANLRDNAADGPIAMGAVVSLDHTSEWLWAKALKDRKPVEVDGAKVK